MLNECLAITVREREKIETYRDGRTTDVTMTENPTKKKVSISVLDDDGKYALTGGGCCGGPD